jgi:acyl-CoA synthetase (AMP-forming)/AMP-acid ligase II
MSLCDEKNHQDWLSTPAIVWDTSNQHSASSSYWNAEDLTPLVKDLLREDHRLHFLSYRDVFFLVCRIAERIYARISDVLTNDESSDWMAHKCKRDKLLHVAVAVVIPEGIFLPLAIAAVHACNIPSCVGSDDDQISFSVVLVPTDPTEGRERLAQILQDARPVLVLTCADYDQKRLEEILLDQEKSAVSIEDTRGPSIYQCCQTQVVDLREWVRKSILQGHEELDYINSGITGTLHAQLSTGLRNICTSTRCHPRRISHIVYTSGTTGIPKGCISSIQALQNYISSKNTVHGISSSSVVVLASALSFDPCLSDILGTFSARATLAIAPRDSLRQILPQVLQSMHVTHCLCTPTLWSTMASMGVSRDDLPALQVVALGGEPLPNHIGRSWARPSTDTSDSLRLCATFGVTEACVYQTFGEIRYQTEGTQKGQDVGMPFPGLGVDICLESDQSALVNVEDGTVGEIILHGNQLDELTCYSKKQLAHKFIHDCEHYYYRTGDRGYIDPVSKRLYVLGRIQGEDGMVKFNGIRIELDEIEAALAMDGNNAGTILVDSLIAVVSEEDSSKAQDLIAYVVLSSECFHELKVDVNIPESGVLCTPGPLLTLLRERCRLRARVTPSAFVIIPRVPLSPTGKRFRKGVPPLSSSVPLDQLFLGQSGTGGVAAAPLRKYGTSGPIVADQIIDCLNLQPSQEAMLTTSATFAMLGGDSLAATRVSRSLYALHHKVANSRFLGGQFGNLGGCFAVVHLLRVSNLGAYVDWLDQHGVGCSLVECPRSSTALPEKGVGINQPLLDASLSKETPNDESINNNMSIQDAESAQLYDATLQAVTSGQSMVALALLDTGADPNFGKHEGRLGKITSRDDRKKIFRASPMHLACLNGMSKVVEKLLQKGSKFNSPDASGMFPILLAASGESRSDHTNVDDECARLECIKLLLLAGTPLTMKDGNKQSILHAAARAGHCKILRYVMSEWKEKVCIHSNQQDCFDWRGTRKGLCIVNVLPGCN